METPPCLLDFAKGLAPPPPMSAEEATQFAQLEALAQELYTTQNAQRRVFAQNTLENAVASHVDSNGNSGNYSAMLGKCLIFLKYTKSQYLSVNQKPKQKHTYIRIILTYNHSLIPFPYSCLFFFFINISTSLYPQ